MTATPNEPLVLDHLLSYQLNPTAVWLHTSGKFYAGMFQSLCSESDNKVFWLHVDPYILLQPLPGGENPEDFDSLKCIRRGTNYLDGQPFKIPRPCTITKSSEYLLKVEFSGNGQVMFSRNPENVVKIRSILQG